MEGPALTDRICSLYPNPGKDAEFVHQRELDRVIRESAQTYRHHVDERMWELNVGFGFGEGGKSRLRS